MILLIPAYEPTFRLLDVIAGVRDKAPWMTVLVVDDGSGPAYAPVFEAARAVGARVLAYPVNRGKGQALKTGFRYVQSRWAGEAVVCADSDGQHSTDDILRVAAAVDEGGSVVLGGRRFAGAVPLRSRFGNTVSRGAFRLATGEVVHDTQTGLRGYPAAVVPWLLTVRGDRFEYELNLLIEARPAGVRMREIPIETIYLDHNASSHFRPVVDSVRVFTPLLRFAASSFASFIIDFVLLQLLFAATGSLVTSVVGARLVSATANFVMNRQIVFGSHEPGNLRRHVIGYFSLAIVLLAASYGLLAGLTALGVPLVAAKLVTDVVLYLVGFQVQKRLVFTRRARVGEPARAPLVSAGSPRRA